MRHKLSMLLAVAVLLVASSSAMAASSEPMLSMTRLSAGASVDYAGFQNAGEQPLPEFPKAWEFGLVASYNLIGPAPGEKGPALSLTAASCYDVDNKWFRHRLGLRLTLFKGGSY